MKNSEAYTASKWCGKNLAELQQLFGKKQLKHKMGGYRANEKLFFSSNLLDRVTLKSYYELG